MTTTVIPQRLLMPRSAHWYADDSEPEARLGPVTRDREGTNGDLELPRTEDGYIASIVRRGSHGETMWELLPPDGGRDAWVSVSLEGEDLLATSWSGWQVRLSVADGTELERRFAK